jgi:hypothetical protein
MTTDEILAKLEKPGIVAELLIVSRGGISYQAHVGKYTVHFNIEIDQLGTSRYFSRMETWRIVKHLVQIIPQPD